MKDKEQNLNEMFVVRINHSAYIKITQQYALKLIFPSRGEGGEILVTPGWV